ncbi:transporter substrate-binding domain-containing protein [Shewanella sp. VB17]|uniref:substrate-binding periplasmic protein n=1 Tax=Shewanella sp. VB17 TaxID=2739432 RepID=UPI0015646502|nr:transporter substrate-binding domain-containing protein [Shewanella sp. VB17]NRD75134.1 transporter substrate-binding domain-containing protein [Shewanella sp. VB17]
MKEGIILSVCLLLITFQVKADEYHFVSIENLFEQEVGRKVLPYFYSKLGHQITITPLPGKRASTMLSIGEKDGEIMRIFSYGIEHPDAIRVPTHYYSLQTMAFYKKNTGIVIKTKDDLAQYKVAKVRGVKHTNNMTKGMRFVYDMESTLAMMDSLESGEVQVALTNTIDGLIAIKARGYNDIVKLSEPLSELYLYHYIHQDHPELASEVNEVIKKMAASGELEIIIEQAEYEVFNHNGLRFPKVPKS